MEARGFFARLALAHQTVTGSGEDVLKRVLATAHTMLCDRGCRGVTIVSDPLRNILSNEPVIVSDSCIVYVHAEDKVGVKAARTMGDAAHQTGKLVVCISVQGPTPFTRRECVEQERLIQFLLLRQCCFPIVHHTLVPSHVPVTDHGFDVANLPKILVTDAVVQYYNFPVGTVLKIERNFGGHEPTVYYRVVTPGAASVM